MDFIWRGYAQSKIAQEIWLQSLPMAVEDTMTAILENSTFHHAVKFADKVVARVGNANSALYATR